jgi:hypothetical protein
VIWGQARAALGRKYPSALGDEVSVQHSSPDKVVTSPLGRNRAPWKFRALAPWLRGQPHLYRHDRSPPTHLNWKSSTATPPKQPSITAKQ